MTRDIDAHRIWFVVGVNLPRPFTRTAAGEIFGITGRQEEKLVKSSPKLVYDYGPGTADKLWRSFDGHRSWSQQPIKLPDGFRGGPGMVTRLSTGHYQVGKPRGKKASSKE